METIARGVDARVRGDQIVEVWLSSKKQTFKNPPARQAKGLEGRAISEVRRAGKHIVMDLGSRPGGDIDAQWIVHLGMTGRLLVTTPEADIAPHTHARLRLKSGKELRFVDPRRFGRLEFRDLSKGEAFGAPGAEPLEVQAEAFAAMLRGRKLAIKAALLNQSLLSGVGNIYADESLFRAGVRPKRSAGRLTATERERLRTALKDVLRHAIKLGGSSVSDYVDAEGMRGFFQLEHMVYQRTGEPCRVCKTPIKRIVVGGRSTHFCPKCQQ